VDFNGEAVSSFETTLRGGEPEGVGQEMNEMRCRAIWLLWAPESGT
jgi:hypothetical protein